MPRTKKAPNKATFAREAALERAGLMPRDFLLGVMRDETKPEATRLDAAKAVAPYCHPRLATVENRHGDLDGKPLNATIKVEFVSAKKEP